MDTAHAKCFGTRLEPFEIYDFGDLDARHDCIVNVASFFAVITPSSSCYSSQRYLEDIDEGLELVKIRKRRYRIRIRTSGRLNRD